MVIYVATGAKISLKSTPAIVEYSFATNYISYLTILPPLPRTVGYERVVLLLHYNLPLACILDLNISNKFK